MKNYRIKKITYNNITKYYPQHKILFWWYNIFPVFLFGNLNFFGADKHGGFSSLEEAEKNLYGDINGPDIEYLEVNCPK